MMNKEKVAEILSTRLEEVDVSLESLEIKPFPDEIWIVGYVSETSLLTAQSMSSALENALRNDPDNSDKPLAVMFRPQRTQGLAVESNAKSGRLAGNDVNQLIQLLEARSRTSDAVPSLNYMEDPRATPTSVAASRHQFILGRRGVGKTALLLEAKRIAEQEGHSTVWLNAHVLRNLTVDEANLTLTQFIVDKLIQRVGNSEGPSALKLRRISVDLRDNEGAGRLKLLVPEINSVFRDLLRPGLLSLYVFLDDFYLYPFVDQPRILDFLAGLFRDSNAWLKIASIDHLTRPWEGTTRIGLEIPNDATKIDLDITLEDPQKTQKFLESVLDSFTASVGIKSTQSIATSEALGRLVLASGGVPRDYLNLFAASIGVARNQRMMAQKIGREDVAVAAGNLARSKKRDLEQDAAKDAAKLLTALSKLSKHVRSLEHTYFRVDIEQKAVSEYEMLALLSNLRFIHFIQTVSDQHRSGVRYEAFILDLSEYSDVRLQRRLHVLDLENGQWVLRKTGEGRKKESLSGTQLRDKIRQSPVVDLKVLN